MSKRYGRNQKRAHRAEIERLEQKLLGYKQQLGTALAQRDRVQDKLRRQEAHIAEIVDTINGIVQFSAVTPVQEYQYYIDPDHNPARLRLHRRRSSSTTDDLFDSAAVVYAMDILELDLWDLRTVLTDYSETFEKIVYVLIPDGKRLCLKVSRSAFEQFRRGRLPELGRELYAQIMDVLRSMQPGS